MATMSGVDGKLYLYTSGGTVPTTEAGYITTFNLSISSGTADVSTLGTVWDEYIGTNKSWSGSISAIFDPSDTQQSLLMTDILSSDETTKITAKFVINSALTLQGDILVTGVSSTVSRTDAVSIDFNFQGTGALSQVS